MKNGNASSSISLVLVLRWRIASLLPYRNQTTHNRGVHHAEGLKTVELPPQLGAVQCVTFLTGFGREELGEEYGEKEGKGDVKFCAERGHALLSLLHTAEQGSPCLAYQRETQILSSPWTVYLPYGCLWAKHASDAPAS